MSHLNSTQNVTITHKVIVSNGERILLMILLICGQFRINKIHDEISEWLLDRPDTIYLYSYFDVVK